MEAELVALVDVRRAGQRQQDHDCRPRSPLPQLPIQPRRCAVGHKPRPGDLVGRTGFVWWQPVPGRHSWYVMATQQPARRGAVVDHVGQPAVDHAAIVLRPPIRVLHREVEGIPETVGRGVPGSSRRMYSRLCDCVTRRIVGVEYPSPVGVDLVHVVAIPERVRAVLPGQVGDLAPRRVRL